MTFRGWPAEAVTFFEGLELDNSKAYFDEHKETYLRAVRGPMAALLAELAPTFGATKLFRPNRDIRFSNDKTPYKTNIAATVGSFGYISLSADALGAGGGMVHLLPDQLDRYRRAVDDDRTGRELEAIVDDVRTQGHECGPHEALKSAPRGYPKDHPRIELLRAKGLIAWHQWPVGPWLRKASAKDRIVELLVATKPLGAWLDTHVGDTALEPRRR